MSCKQPKSKNLTLTTFTGINVYNIIGKITIKHDRIVNIDFKVPIIYNIMEKFARERSTGKKLPQTETFKRETQYQFELRKLSKGELPFRRNQLTHEIICETLNKDIGYSLNFFVAPSFRQILVLRNNLKLFPWQTQDFKSHMFKYIATGLLSAAAGVAGTIIVIKPCDKANSPSTQTQNRQSNDTIAYQVTHKIMKSATALP